LEQAGQRVTLVQAYPYRGGVLGRLSLYDYMSVVKLKRKGRERCVRGEVELDEVWPLSKTWIQVLQRPAEHAVVCLDGYLGMDLAKKMRGVTEGTSSSYLIVRAIVK